MIEGGAPARHRESRAKVRCERKQRIEGAGGSAARGAGQYWSTHELITNATPESVARIPRKYPP